MTLIIPQKVEVKWHPKNIAHYEDRGYSRGKMGEQFLVDIEHLSLGSTFEVSIKCDYCSDVYERIYKLHLRDSKKSPIKKDACSKCIGLKREESNLHVHGVKMPSALPEVRERIQATNIEIYGATAPLGSKEYKKEYDKRIFEKYGVEYVSQIPYVRELISQSRIQYYKDLDKKGESKSPFKRGSSGVSYSRQQVYIHSVTGGEFNYPVGRYYLDVAFPEDKIFIEYDGGGHDLSVKFGQLTREEFDQKEKDRFNYLYYEEGWREIRLVSLSDRLPDRENLLLTINSAYKALQETSYMMAQKIYLEKRDSLDIYKLEVIEKKEIITHG